MTGHWTHTCVDRMSWG